MIWLLALFACKDGVGGDPIDDLIGGNDGDGVDLPSRAPDETITGDLSEGSVIALGWAEQQYCWPGNENQNFDGAHVIYVREQPRGIDLYLKLQPAAGLDLSLYALRQNSEAQIPPNVTSSFDCEAVYDASGDSNPGVAEELFLQNWVDFEIALGVAGTDGKTSGGYTLEIWKEQGANLDTAR